MIGFSVPNNGDVAVISCEGVHHLNLNRTESVRHDLSRPAGGERYDTRSGKLLHENADYSILGLYGGTPILRSPQGERLEVLQESTRLLIHSNSAEQPVELHFEDLSGDWCKATFSLDGSWILVGVPYELFVFKRTE
jgi:hypothetical protein